MSKNATEPPVEAPRDRTTPSESGGEAAGVSALFEAMPHASLLVTERGRIVASNGTFRSRFEREEPELLDGFATLIAGPYGDKAEGVALLELIAEGQGVIELTAFDGSGMAFPCTLNVGLLEDPIGDATRLVSIRETAEQHRLKATISVVEQAARREKQLLQAVAQPLDDIVIALDDAERVVLINEAAGKGFALSAEGIRGRGLIDLELPGSIRGVWLAFLASTDAAATKTVRVALGGEEQTVLLQFRRARSESGSPLGSVLVARALVVEEGLGAIPRSRRPAALCHDLRTRLASIEGFSRALLEEPSMDSETRGEFLSIIGAETERLSALLETLLSSLGGGKD